MKTQKQLMERKYMIIARLYDSVFGALEKMVFSKRDRNPRLALAGKIPDAGLNVLDIGCGTGTQAIALAGNTNSVTGIDISPHMLARAEKKAGMSGRGNVRFYTMDAGHMNFPDSTFDVAMTWFALHEMDRGLIHAVLKEASRILKTGGTLYIVDYEHDENSIMDFFFRLYIRLLYPQKIKEYFGLDWKGVLESAGFRNVVIERYAVSKIISAQSIRQRAVQAAI